MVYLAASHGNGMSLQVYCAEDECFFFPYDESDYQAPRTQNEIMAVLVRACHREDWQTFQYWFRRITWTNHTIWAIHHNPNNHVLIPYLKPRHCNPGNWAWHTKMMATFATCGVLTTYLELCGQKKDENGMEMQQEEKEDNSVHPVDDEGEDCVVYDRILADLVCMMDAG